ncbi:sulfotransferase [Anabaenopsis arnoldii]|uniref:Sulfotransferase n=1 Tax=Anabaenopsis arnoldii TaxID=2152938 RepID=A0ABT5AXU5_9CYAN|nr:sulfotransferase [Anabaenopsis arnoldii]MDB9541115.1 sulfotransferase [Anabaenopsis arnoldii]MDH6093554.1 sulfotransferase [Anabaenopsis arnoldii]
MNWKLTTGKLIKAWQDYPKQRQRIAWVPTGKPILVTGTHRSGTTWFASMLAASGIWYIHEPFSPLKQRWKEWLSYQSPRYPSPEVDRLMTSVLNNQFPESVHIANTDHPLMPLRLFPSPSQRIMIKDPLACLMTEYLTKNFDLETLILFRHPCGFVASIRRLGWPCGAPLKRFLQNSDLMADHLHPYQDLLEKYCDEDTIYSATVLYGALTTVLWDCVQKKIGKPLFFEQLCQNPLDEFAKIFEDLNLPYDDQVKKRHQHLCYGELQAIENYHPHAVARNSLAMAHTWKDQLEERQINQIKNIWNNFGISLYVDQ